MGLLKAGSFVLVLLVAASFGQAGAADPVPSLQVNELKDNTLSLTVRAVKEINKSEARIDGKPVKMVPGSVKSNPEDGSHTFQVELPCDLKPGKATLEVVVGEAVLKPEPFLEIPDPYLGAGKQPLIRDVQPAGGLPNATIKIVGQNFGEDLSRIYITAGPVNTRILPVSVSKPDGQGMQEVVFGIPPVPHREKSDSDKDKEVDPFSQILNHSSVRNHALLRLTASDRPSNCAHLNVLHPQGLWKIAGLSIALIVILLSPLLAICCWTIAVGFVVLLGGYLLFALTSDSCWIFAALFVGLALALLGLARANRETLQPIVRTLFIEKDTETYSLSKVQAFAWTVVLIGSYVYFAVGRGILVGTAEIPDLNAGLLGLLAISYTGLIASRGISRNKPKNDLTPTPASWTNLITEGNDISITRLQLIGFTIAGIAVYIFYISGSELFFEGMPDIPPTLNGLMAISQGGYLGGKIVNGTAVNYITPRRVKTSESLTIIGVGFLDKTKVLVQGVPEAIDTEFVHSNSLILKLPATMGDLGVKQMVFIPPTGGSFVVSEAFELIAPEILDPKVSPPNQLSFTIKGVEVAEGELRPSINNKPVRVIKQTGNHFVLESEDELQAGSTLSLKTEEGDDLGSVVI